MSSIVGGNRGFLNEVQCKLADAQFIPHYIRAAYGVLSAGHKATLAIELA